MGSEHYCLRWNNHQSNLLGVFSQLLHDESLVDVTLACSEGTSIRAHKVVLSACSSYFQSLFVDHPSRHPIVILKDVRFAELRTLVEFMYKGEVNVEYCQLSALLKTAESLKVKGLAEMTTVSASASAPPTGNAGNGTSSASSALPSAARAVIVDDQNDVAQDLAPARPPSEPALAPTRPPSASPPRASPLLGVRRARHEPPVGADASPHRPLSHGPPHRDRMQHRPRSPPSPLEQRASPPHHRTAKEEPPDRDEEMRTSSPDDDMSSVHSNGGHSDNIGINMSISTNMNSTLANAELRLAGLAGLPGLPGLGGRHAPLALAGLGGPGGAPGGHAHPVGAAHPLLGAVHPLLRAEPIAGPSGLPPVQQVPLVVWNLFSHCASLKKEVDWERSTDDKSGGESSSDYRMSHESETHDGGGRGRDDGDAQLYPCIYCGAAFPHQSKLTRHILSHSLETLKYREAACGVGAGRPSLALGVPPGSPFAPLHPDEMPLDLELGPVEPGNVVLCKFCGKSFPDVSSLIAHLPVHTGDRPFKCEFCGKAFKLRHHMKDHCRVHTGERPFRCALCGKTFSRSTILKAHEKTHYPKYVRKFLSPSPVDTEEESPHQ